MQRSLIIYLLSFLSFILFVNSSKSQVSQPEFEALVAVYNSTNGVSWHNNAGWNTSNNNVSNDWHGITVSAGRVIELELNNNNLQGFIPEEIGNLTQLSLLRLNFNSLSGEIPSQIQLLVNLARLDLDENNLSGTIPSGIGNLVNLSNLQLAGNNLSGAVPNTFTNLTNLRILTLRDNELNSLPNLSPLSALETFRIERNSLHFNSIEPVFDVFSEIDFTYSPQRKVGEPEEHTLYYHEQFTMSVIVGGQNNTYQWFFNGDEIEGADRHSYIINQFVPETHEGIYHCEINNNVVLGLTLISEDIELNYYGDTDPIVETYEATNITAVSAELRGRLITPGSPGLARKGFIIDTEPNAHISGEIIEVGFGAGSIYQLVTDLAPSTTYYFLAYVFKDDNYFYGEELEFTTELSTPTVLTFEAEDIQGYSARLGGNVTYDGGSTVLERGIYLGEEADVIENGEMIYMGSGDGEYLEVVENLIPATGYYFAAFATNAYGLAVGEEKTFTTNSVEPLVETENVYDITHNSANVGGLIIFDGGADIIESGVYWGTELNAEIPEASGTKHQLTLINNNFEGVLTGLSPDTYYYIMAYAVNEIGEGYGDIIEFLTGPHIPIVTTFDAADISSNAAVVSGEVISGQGAEVIERGIYWGKDPYPMEEEILQLGSGLGVYSYNLENLDPNTRYYFQAYAVNSEGMAYGEILSFQTDIAAGEPFIPNAFNPNSKSQVNRIFKPVFEYEPSDFSMEIFNRWGSIVFSTGDYLEGWNGKSFGGDSPIGAYQFKISYTDYKGEKQVKIGVLNLVR